MPAKTPLTLARGDGIGPEIMDATLAVLQAAGAALDIEEVAIGQQVYEAGHSTGIDQAAWDSLARTRLLLKAPITTPRGGGFKSLNVTLRKTLGLYANVRPCVSYHPFVQTRHPQMDVVIIRENEEDLYAGIEHRQTQEVVQCLKLVSRAGCERIIRYAFEYARLHHRARVTAFVKDNIMKMTDGLFHRVFREVASHYPEITADSMIIDIGAARLADTPERFDVIVTLNLYGDIISDIAAQITGSVGLAGSANIGDRYAMFEAIHGSAPDIAGKGIANPSGLLLAGVMMLVQIGQGEVAETIHNAWYKTLEDGFHTPDIFDRSRSRKRCGTRDFAECVIARLGQEPSGIPPIRYGIHERVNRSGVRVTLPMRQAKLLVGADVFVEDDTASAADLAARVQAAMGPGLELNAISSRGQVLWPDGHSDALTTDHWRLRFSAPGQALGAIREADILALLTRLSEAGLGFIKVENLYTFDGEAGFSGLEEL